MTALDLPQISSKITFFEIISTSHFQIKITASVRKSLRQDRGLCYFFSYTYKEETPLQ